MPEMSDAEFTRLYGEWAARTPADAGVFFAEYSGAWWVAGGWSIEAYTGVPRPHEDMDIGVLGAEFAELRRHLRGRLDAWTPTYGTLTPLLPDDRPDAAADDVLPEGCAQLWTRADAASRWEFDILLSPGDAQTWVYKRDPVVRMPMSDALWERDGVHYLRPEIQLLYKAKGDRAKDRDDLAAVMPRLRDERRSWLVDALARTAPQHPWLKLLDER
ncbi:nucleotidyltransferase domain-containing protein [Paramicrobacterium agarici]|uniref:nucleotidyltransferase domain-containing protein n=1 Tax=Paramicrobacterium agarici TaxID=630514 RepID=UPI00116BCDAB|nr:hypothetical protein [Microbacterium agarici]TQO21673.1 hypothetical protein FB385_0482 [Microbacterium agarici]